MIREHTVHPLPHLPQKPKTIHITLLYIKVSFVCTLYVIHHNILMYNFSLYHIKKTQQKPVQMFNLTSDSTESTAPFLKQPHPPQHSHR
jgi:hypothetical protein